MVEKEVMSPPPTWMESLIDFVASCMEPHSELGPLAYRWRNEDDYWEVWVYPTPGEIVGGAVDGAIISPGFSLDAQELSTAFEKLEGVHWQAHPFGPHDREGQSLAFEGVYDGHGVWLVVLSDAPEDEEPGFKFYSARDGGNR